MARLIPNKYAGACVSCGKRVPEQGGTIRKAASGRWEVRCLSCTRSESTVPATPAEPVRTYALTSEQEQAVALFREGRSIAIQAGAGTGKTSTLVAIAQSTTRTGTYVAFNRAIVTDAAQKLPANVVATTAHSLAFRQVGKLYKERLSSSRIPATEVARRVGISPLLITKPDGSDQVLHPAWLASQVLKAIGTFCNTADKTPGPQHLPYIPGIDSTDDDGKRLWENNRRVRSHLASSITDAWADIVDPAGCLRFTHDCYLKIWELGLHGAPRIPGDFILFDEAQDASPVLLSVVEQQQVQVVFVGDAQQAIYAWRGAVDALDRVGADATTFLTNSFRFGPEIAEAANTILSQIPGAQLRLIGLGQPGAVQGVSEPDAILCRTNGAALERVIEQLACGRSVHLVGGHGDLRAFALGAQELQRSGQTRHPELVIFDSWAAVVDFAANDPQGEELAALVRLVERYGVESILNALDATTPEEDADVVVTTAHRSKGREWDAVALSGDFPESTTPEELRLLYVAVTRARRQLDITGCPAALALINLEG